MSPATAAAARRAPAPRRAPVHKHAPRRPRLRLITARRAGERRRHLPEVLAIALLCGSLLAIVVGHSMLAQGQVRMGRIQSALTQEQATNRVTVLNVAALETPARISQEAGALHLVQPSQILQLPSVSLSTPLPPIKITGVAGK